MGSSTLGYAVIDLKTTGLWPSWHDRVIEIAVVLLDASGADDRRVEHAGQSRA
jgi:DNA polymerase III epsilon subunit-like protein